MRITALIISLLLGGSASAGTPDTVTLDVQNMTCATCPVTIKKALEKVSGVKAVKVDYEHKTATVQLDPGKANAVLLTKATTEAGFPATARK